MIIRLTALALVLLLASPALACDRGTVTGRVSYVRDGDTIELGAMAIRLDGLAAPKMNRRQRGSRCDHRPGARPAGAL